MPIARPNRVGYDGAFARPPRRAPRTEANGARWPSRSSKSVASRWPREGWVRLPGASASLRSPSGLPPSSG